MTGQDARRARDAASLGPSTRVRAGSPGGSPDDASAPLDRQRILDLLEQLDERLRGRGVAASLYVVGGAAVAVTVVERRVTRDVDVAMLDAVVAEEATAIARAEGLPEDWLSASAAPWVPTPVAGERRSRAGLTVRYAPPEHLLAMKMVALRQQDAPDIGALVDHLGLSKAPAARFAEVLQSAYAGEGELEQVLGVSDRVEEEVESIARRIAAFASRPDRG